MPQSNKNKKPDTFRDKYDLLYLPLRLAASVAFLKKNSRN